MSCACLNFLQIIYSWLSFFLLQSLMEYEEHEKRAWSVDFSRTDPSMLVSGSAVYKYIVEEDDQESTKEWSEDHIHGCLK